jgi:hypothetical protein
MSTEQSGVKRRSRSAVEALVSEYEASGLSRKAFCAGRNLAVATLDKYRIRVRQAAAPRLMAVDVRPAEGVKAANFHLAVALGNGRRIEIGDRIDAVLLAELIGIVERA